MAKAGFLRVAAAVRRGSEGPSEGIRRIRRGFPEEEPSATAERIAPRISRALVAVGRMDEWRLGLGGDGWSAVALLLPSECN